MQDPLSKIKQELSAKSLLELVNGYFLSFLGIGVVYLLIKGEVDADLKKGLFFILMVLVYGAVELLTASSRDRS